MDVLLCWSFDLLWHNLNNPVILDLSIPFFLAGETPLAHKIDNPELVANGSYVQRLRSEYEAQLRELGGD